MQESELEEWRQMYAETLSRGKLWRRTRNWNTAVRAEENGNLSWALSKDGATWLVVGDSKNPRYSEEEADQILSLLNKADDQYYEVFSYEQLIGAGYSQERHVVSDLEYARLLEMIDSPPPPTPALRAAYRAYGDSMRVNAEGKEVWDMEKFKHLNSLRADA